MRNSIACLIAACALAACATKPAATPVTREVALDASNIAEAQAAGYKIVNEKGTTLLCRKEPKVGSHVQTTTTCLTAQEWEQLKNDNKTNIDQMSHRIPPPVCGRNSARSC